MEQAGDAFLVFDYAGKIFDVNHQACQSLGYTREELLGMTILEVDTEVEKMKHKPRFWESLEPGQHITIEGMHRRKNGSTFPAEVRLGRLDLGEKRLLLALARDITKRKQREDELSRAFVQIKGLKDKLEEENIYLRKEIELRYRHEKIVGESDAIKRVLSQAEKVANTGTCVLILGETGTGKELLAYAIHNMSNRKGHAMITVNCAALPATLIESELFGREKGAFTGALKRQIGRFESAHGSTIFLDEIGDLPIELQAKILRALQEGQFERLGSSKTLSVDVRVIAATNRNLAEMVREQKFRNDLYYRLNVFPITLPPLRERQEDIPMLVWSIVNEFAKSMGKPITKIQKKAMQSLTQYAWPGNIRELKNIIERAMIMSSGSILEIEHIVDKDAPTDISMSLEEIEKTHILKVLQNTNWRIRGEKGAAKILEIKATTLEARMKKIGIQRQT
jgi:PAS domain S-box-containing protein